MSPKFALSLLLLCFVLLGLSDAQGREQKQPKFRGVYRNTNQDGTQTVADAPPTLGNPADCASNTLAGNNPDRFPKRS